MPSLSRTEVEEIALLARLHLEEAEIAQLQTDLGAILEHFGALAAVNTVDVPPMTHAVPADVDLRPDTTLPSLPVDAALSGAPRRAGDTIEVPAIIAGQDG